jgi:hypothetical protein
MKRFAIVIVLALALIAYILVSKQKQLATSIDSGKISSSKNESPSRVLGTSESINFPNTPRQTLSIKEKWERKVDLVIAGISDLQFPRNTLSEIPSFIHYSKLNAFDPATQFSSAELELFKLISEECNDHADWIFGFLRKHMGSPEISDRKISILKCLVEVTSMVAQRPGSFNQEKWAEFISSKDPCMRYIAARWLKVSLPSSMRGADTENQENNSTVWKGQISALEAARVEKDAAIIEVLIKIAEGIPTSDSTAFLKDLLNGPSGSNLTLTEAINAIIATRGKN